MTYRNAIGEITLEEAQHLTSDTMFCVIIDEGRHVTLADMSIIRWLKTPTNNYFLAEGRIINEKQTRYGFA